MQARMDVRKRGENPPLPRSREGNESPEQATAMDNTMAGRRASRKEKRFNPQRVTFLPLAGRPVRSEISREVCSLSMVSFLRFFRFNLIP